MAGFVGIRRTPILIGQSGASVMRVQTKDGTTWIEKNGCPAEIQREAEVLAWCAGRLPVPQILAHTSGLLRMTELPGTNLAEAPAPIALRAIVDALDSIHSIPCEDCPFDAGWSLRLRQAKERMDAGRLDPADFDEENLGREPADLFAELASHPPPTGRICFTHGDASLPNFLFHGEELSGIVDWSRAGLTHPAQDWALALRSMRSNFGLQAERELYERVPEESRDKGLLRQFRLLDEFF